MKELPHTYYEENQLHIMVAGMEKEFDVCIRELDDDFDIKYAKLISEKQGEDYYLKMVIAWYFATALAKQYDAVLPFLENRCLDTWTHNKAIQKALESFRVSEEHKKYLRTLKIK